MGGKETRTEAELAGKELTDGIDAKTVGEINTELVAVTVKTSKNARRETCGTVACDECVKIHTKILDTVDIGLVATTAAIGMAVQTLNDIAEAMGKAE